MRTRTRSPSYYFTRHARSLGWTGCSLVDSNLMSTRLGLGRGLSFWHYYYTYYVRSVVIACRQCRQFKSLLAAASLAYQCYHISYIVCTYAIRSS